MNFVDQLLSSLSRLSGGKGVIDKAVKAVRSLSRLSGGKANCTGKSLVL